MNMFLTSLTVFAAASGKLGADIVFALDYSSSVSEEELRKEINFVKHLAKSWNVTSAALIVYGDDSPTLIPFHSEQPFSEEIGVLRTETLPQSKYRRMDLALTKAAEILPAVTPGSQNQHQLVVLISAGKQSSSEESNEENDLLVSASEELYSRNVKVIIVPVGLETDFKELGLIVKRPQCLFPLSGFADLTQLRAQGIAFHIRETIGEISFVTCIFIACCCYSDDNNNTFFYIHKRKLHIKPFLFTIPMMISQLCLNFSPTARQHQ